MNAVRTMQSAALASVVAMMILVGGVVGPRGALFAGEQAKMDKMIGSAKTAADHEAIAKHYEAEATAAKAKAAEHRNMAEGYKKLGGALIEKLHFDQHCETLAKNYDGAAKEYEALAKAHRDMAKMPK